MTLLASLVPVFTAIIGALLAYFMQSRGLSRARDWQVQDEGRELAIAKGEELYSLIDAWSKAAGSNFFLYRKVMLGELDYNQALDGVIDIGAKRTEKFERIELLISVYFPEISTNFENLRNCIFTSSSIESDYRSNYKVGIYEADKHLPAYEKVMVQAEEVTNQILQKLASRIRDRALL